MPKRKKLQYKGVFVCQGKEITAEEFTHIISLAYPGSKVIKEKQK